MGGIKSRWHTFYSGNIEHLSKEIFSHVEKMIIGTLIVSAGAHAGNRRGSVAAAWEAQDERFCARRHGRQHDHRGRGRRSRARGGGGGGRCAAACRGDRLAAARREPCLVLLETLQRRRAAG